MTTAEHIADLRGKYRFTMGLMTESVAKLVECTDRAEALALAESLAMVSAELAVRFVDYVAFVSDATGCNFYNELVEVVE